MFQNYVMEIKETFDGEFEHNVYWLYDEDVTIAMRKAEAKYYEVLATATLSATASHSAILFTSEGVPMLHGCYKHEAS